MFVRVQNRVEHSFKQKKLGSLSNFLDYFPVISNILCFVETCVLGFSFSIITSFYPKQKKNI
jgi:hypothetical protein